MFDISCLWTKNIEYIAIARNRTARNQRSLLASTCSLATADAQAAGSEDVESKLGHDLTKG